LASDLVRRRVDLIVALATTPGAQAAKAATQTIPIVFIVGTDPFEDRLVPRLARPGGNLTGVTTLGVELLAKRLSLMHELVPSASIGVLINPANRQAENETRDVQTAAHTLGMGLLPLNASTPNEIQTAFETLVREGAGGLVVSSEALFLLQRTQIAALAARYKVPAISAQSDYINVGGFMSYRNPSHCWRLCRPYPQRDEARRPASAAGDQDRARHKSQSCQGAGNYRADIDFAVRDHGD
jgi:putative ABC transport system substrate-binding protein